MTSQAHALTVAENAIIISDGVGSDDDNEEEENAYTPYSRSPRLHGSQQNGLGRGQGR